jgi:hypothetical protein
MLGIYIMLPVPRDNTLTTSFFLYPCNKVLSFVIDTNIGSKTLAKS